MPVSRVYLKAGMLLLACICSLPAWAQSLPADPDGDGVVDVDDHDDDNDGLLDTDEDNRDADADTVVDRLDLDSDNDSIYDVNERGGYPLVTPSGRLDGASATTGLAADAGRPPVDTDGDGVPDFRDLDSDNDGLVDLLEARGSDVDGNGRLDNPDDSNGDGADDALSATTTAWIDTDGDSVPDHLDRDSDNDGWSDLLEAHGTSLDADNDGTLDGFVDTDGDGLSDDLLGQTTRLVDTDSDGVPDQIDLDSDGDGFSDLVESGSDDADDDGQVDTLADSDADGVPDSVDVDFVGGSDSDGDGIVDDADVDNLAGQPDSDGDGIVDSADPDANGDGFVGPAAPGQGTPVDIPDDDDDGVADFQQPVGSVRAGLDGNGIGCRVAADGTPGERSIDLLLAMLLVLAGLRLGIGRWRRKDT